MHNISIRDSMDRRNCMSCGSHFGTTELKITNLCIYLCPGCVDALIRILEDRP